MRRQLKDPILNQKFFELLFPLAYPELANDVNFSKKLSQLIDDDVFSIGSLFEVAIASQSKLLRESTIGRDFTDGSDAKTVSVRKGTRTRRKATIKNVDTKSGWLRVSCYERLTDKFYYFMIPASAYRRPDGKSRYISIPFTTTGEPVRTQSCRTEINWWEFEVKSFQEVCKRKRSPKNTASTQVKLQT